MTTRLETIRELHKKANIDLGDVPSQSRSAWTTVVRKAKEDLERELVSYGEFVRGRSVAVVLRGTRPDVEEFAKITANETGTPNLDVNKYYGQLSQKLFSQQAGRNGIPISVSHHDVLRQAIRGLEKQLDIIKMPSPDFIPGFTMSTPEDAMSYVRTVLAKKVGSELTGIMISKEIVPLALDNDYEDGVFVFTLSGVLPEEVPAVTSGFKDVVTIVIDSPPTKEYVLAKLEDVKAALSTSKRGRPRAKKTEQGE